MLKEMLELYYEYLAEVAEGEQPLTISEFFAAYLLIAGA